MTPQRIQLRRTRGWRMPENTIRVARPSWWGNPFHVGAVDAEACVRLFENAVHGHWSPAPVADLGDDLIALAYSTHAAWLKRWRAGRNEFPIEAIHELRGKNLAYWCPLGAPCHADVLLRVANEEDASCE